MQDFIGSGPVLLLLPDKKSLFSLRIKQLFGGKDMVPYLGFLVCQ